jgi:hypothetical protein
MKSKWVLRESAVLTTSYVATDYADVSQFTKIAPVFFITSGGLTSIEYMIAFSSDAINWAYENSESVAAGIITDYEHYYTKTLTGNGSSKLLDVLNMFIKFYVKGTGTVAGSLLKLELIGVR